MNITMLLETGADETTSGYLMCQDLKKVLDAMNHKSFVVATIKEISDTRPDLLLNTNPRAIIEVQKVAGRYFYCGELVTLFTPCMYAFNNAQIAYMMVSALDTPMIAHSPKIYDDIRLEVKRLFNPAIQRKIMANVFLIPYGVSSDYVFAKRTEDLLGNFVAPFTRAITTQKRYPTHQKVTQLTNALYSLKNWPMKTVFYYASKRWAHVDTVDTTGYELRPVIVDRTVYAKEMQEYAFAISCSDDESFGLYYIELILSGVIVLFSDFPWVHMLLPGYKFVTTDEDLPKLAVWVREHYDEAFAYIEKEVVPYINERYRIEKFAQALVEKFGKVEVKEGG